LGFSASKRSSFSDWVSVRLSGFLTINNGSPSAVLYLPVARLSELCSTLVFNRITLALHDMESIKNNIRMWQTVAH